MFPQGNPNGSSEALAMVAEPVWSMLMEQKNNHRVFYEALDAFSSLLFHPKLLWETDPVIIELQQMVRNKPGYSGHLWEMSLLKGCPHFRSGFVHTHWDILKTMVP